MLTMRGWVVGLILGRELRDQLRDRRTLFMVFVLPVLLYPILGALSLRLAALVASQDRRVVVLGAERLPEVPPLLNASRDGFNPELFLEPSEAARYRVVTVEAGSGWDDPEKRTEALRRGDADVLLIVPPNLARQIVEESAAAKPELIYDSGDEQSQGTARVVRELLDRWNQSIVRSRLERDRKSETYLDPVQPESEDVARVRGAGGNVWARLFPFLLVMMSLTGAFYPAVDVCAGEKERGTMETLLISPASRAEIVSGKFLAVLAASIATALVNLLSMAISAQVFFSQIPTGGTGQQAAMGVPPALALPTIGSIAWILTILIPLSAFFSAVCLAMAAMARSMKEGQYYLTPLFLVAMPLVFATLIPGIELGMFTSLLPITGASLLLRTLLQGDIAKAREYFLFVLVPLLGYAALALRWAVDQFQSEAVLFRESDRFELVPWLKHVVRDRGPVPSSGQALLVFLLMVVASWFSSQLIAPSWIGLIESQILLIGAPVVALTFLLTRSPSRTLLLRRPSIVDLALGLGLALAVNPLISELRVWIERTFPLPAELQKQLGQFMGSIPNVATAVFVLALIPAVCEELAFRGFILQGLRRDFRTVSAIILSAVLFGLLHVLISVFQQLFNATLLGLVLGLLAVRTRSLWPGVLFHFVNNALAVVISTQASRPGGGLPTWLFRDGAKALYHGGWIALAAVTSAVLLVHLWRRREVPETGPPGA